MDTPGTILKREREAQGLTLKEISSITRIPVHSLRLIEEDRYDLLPAEVFAKGFLRNYARELHVNTDEIMLAYAGMKGHRLTQPVDKLHNESDSRGPAQAHTERFTMRKIPPSVVFSQANVSPRAGAATHTAMVEASQRTFRFAYLIVFLVVAASLALSILFTGTGEAEEDRRERRPVVSDEEDGSRFLLSDQPGSTVAPTAPVESIERPAFPENDQDSGVQE